jgi:membrane-bound metal-dependent hydrolase YbcI (DUF457 family)
MPGNRITTMAPRGSEWLKRAGNNPTLVCALLAASPDLDLLVHAHRTFTHSIVAIVAVTVAAGVVSRWSRLPRLRLTTMLGAAYATHAALDLIAADPYPPRGIQLLWPFSREFFLAGWAVFPGTERGNLLSWFAIATNTRALVTELAIMVPILAVLWIARGRAAATASPPPPGVSAAAE